MLQLLVSTEAIPSTVLVVAVAVAGVAALLARAQPIFLDPRAQVSPVPSPFADQHKDRTSAPVVRPSTTLPVVGDLLHLARHANRGHDWFLKLQRESGGKPVLLKLPGKPDLLLIATPELFEAVQKDQLESFAKGENFHDLLVDLLGDSIFIVNGVKWKRQRQFLARLFTARTLRYHVAPIVQKHTHTLLDLLGSAAEARQVVDVTEIMHRFALEAFVELAMGVELGQLSAHAQHPFQAAFDTAQLVIARRFSVPTFVWKLKRWLNVGSERELRESLEVVNTMAFDLINQSMEQRKHQSDDRAKHLVDQILEMAETDQLEVQPTEVRDIVVAAMVAGRDTTADTTSWFFHVLSHEPQAVAAIRAELLENVPQLATDPTFVPTMDDVQHLPILEATIREVMRLFPAGAFTVKHCVRDSWLPDGTFVRAGTDVGIAVYALHRLESVWGDDAAQFKPERFLDDSTGKLRSFSPFQLATFSAGPRSCVGKALAMLQLKMVLATVLFHFDLVEEPGQEVVYTAGITLTMKNPLLMRPRRTIAIGA